MADLGQILQVQGVKRITEMTEYPLSLKGSEELLLDDNNSDLTYKVTVDTLLGYIAERIVLNELPPIESGTPIMVIPSGEELDASDRIDNAFYLNIQDVTTQYDTYYVDDVIDA